MTEGAEVVAALSGLPIETEVRIGLTSGETLAGTIEPFDGGYRVVLPPTVMETLTLSRRARMVHPDQVLRVDAGTSHARRQGFAGFVIGTVIAAIPIFVLYGRLARAANGPHASIGIVGGLVLLMIAALIGGSAGGSAGSHRGSKRFDWRTIYDVGPERF